MRGFVVQKKLIQFGNYLFFFDRPISTMEMEVDKYSLLEGHSTKRKGTLSRGMRGWRFYGKGLACDI